MTTRNGIGIAMTALLLAAAPARAEDAAGADAITPPQQAAGAQAAKAEEGVGFKNPLAGPVDKDGKPLNAWARWTTFIDKELDKLADSDLYGVTAQMPKGYASIKWDYTQLTAGKRYNDKHELTPIMAPISLGGGRKLDPGLGGRGGGHVFQASYGILGNFDWYFEVPFQYMHLGFHPKLLDENGDEVTGTNPDGSPDPDYSRKEGIRALHTMLPQLGRPVPAMKYDAEWVMGDINTGFSWNPWRTHRGSAAFTARVFFPTGRVANPNSSLTLGTGPEMDTGLGGWGIGFTQGYDLRLFQYKHWIDVIASSEFTLSYGFEQKRRYPTNFATEPNRNLLQALANGNDGKKGTRDDDYSVFNSFPDLRHLKDLGSYNYTPGFGIQWMTKLNIQLALLGVGVGYGVIHSQEPEMQGDYYFIQMAKSLQLTGQNTIHAIQVGASLSLLPIYIPIDFSFAWRKMVGGYQCIVFDDYWNVIIKTYIPLFR
jgi:hypothetical protein